MTILNGSPVVRLPGGTGDLVDVLVVNEHEYTGFFGRRFSTATGPHSGWRTVVVTLGSRGAAIADAAGTRCVPAPSVRAVDTVGAGDAFCGVLAATLAAGGSIDTAVTRACVAGALAATRRGAASAPTAAELERGTAAPLEPHVSP